ncbi:BTB/POZ domain-containing protein 6-B-like isoform X2 [Anopheles merus]|nr:BTB/POZ domain-containing protein 6-B-like isoform X2 [Anopheles merus]
MTQSNSSSDSEESSCDGLNYDTDTTLCRRLEKMVNNKLLSDVTFIVGPEKRRIYAHKPYLLTASEFFYKMFCGNFIEAQRKEVVLEDVDAELFLIILRLVYSKKVHLNWDNISAIYDCLCKYLLIDYFDPLIRFMESHINDHDTAIMVFLKNDHFNFEQVDEKCMRYIQTNPLYFFGKDEFTSMPEARLNKILQAQRINCTHVQLQQAVVKWSSANGGCCYNNLNKLLEETCRKPYAQKLHLMNNKLIETVSYREADVKLRMTSTKRLALYGFGMYVHGSDKPSIASFTLEKDGVKVHDIEIKMIPSLGYEIVDTMFEEVVLEPNVQYKLCFYEPSCQLTKVVSLPVLFHRHIKIEFESNHCPPLAYLFAKYADCDVLHLPQLCCNTKCKVKLENS